MSEDRAEALVSGEGDERARRLRAFQSLAVVARLHGVAVDAAELAHAHPHDEVETALVIAARSTGLRVRTTRASASSLPALPLPAIGLGPAGEAFVIAAARAEGDAGGKLHVLVHDPAAGRPRVMDAAELAARWDGRILLVASRASLAAELARFDFTWFVPAIVKYRKPLAEVFVASLFVQLLALVTPLLTQVVLDKVLVHQGLSTLTVVGVALVAVAVFETVLSGLRTHALAHAASRIDVELGARLYRHMLRLPLAYFEARRVGESVARVRELENIRQFLTGQALSSVLDALFAVVFLALMLYYSATLTLYVMAAIPLYVVVSVAVTPVLRRGLHEKFHRGAENQAFLVETVSAIETVKAMAAEPHMTREWDRQLAAYVAAGMRTVTTATVGHEAVTLVNRLMLIAVLWAGAYEVMDGALTVGALIAFNMFAQRVANPVVRLAQLWQDFQQVGISMRRLADILDARTEAAPAGTPMPQLSGTIAFRDVRFRYRPEGNEVLRGVSFEVRAGEVIGIVGASGSGKSTIAKLVQRLHVPEHGRILVDGVDLAVAAPSWLRRQMGVVLQDNVLFARTIRENIALVDPGMPMDRVIEAARLAGAHDFVAELPEGYETRIGEHGATLSGGQRQRIALARALAGDPRILILDEATSALDYESERIIQQNMGRIAAGRTVIVIAHRLTALRGADRILVLDRGEVVEEGSHDALVARQGGRYRRLWLLQSAPAPLREELREVAP